MKTLAFTKTRTCGVLVHSAAPPADDEWAIYLEELASWGTLDAPVGLLVVSDGGAPSPAQRRRMQDAAKSHTAAIKVAVMTSSTFARGVLKAMSLFSSQYRGFDPGDLDGALRYLGVHPAERDAVRRAIDACRLEIGAAR